MKLRPMPTFITKKWTEAELQELPQFSMWLPSRYNNAWREHQTIEVDGVEIDEDLAPLLRLLWARGVRTAACCQGHAADYHISNGQLGDGYILFCDFDQAAKFLRCVAGHFAHEQVVNEIKLTATMDGSYGEAAMHFPPLLVERITRAYEASSL